MAVEKESTIEDIMEGSETENVTSDTKVSQMGEEIPEELEVEVPTIEDDLLSEDATPTPKEPEEAQPEAGLSAIEQEFKNRGLDKQFKSVEDMMNRVPEMNKHINDLSVERKRLRELEKQAPQPEPYKAPSSDDFYDDPVSIITKMVEARVGVVNQKLQQIEVDSFVNSKSDYAEMEPLMEAQLERNPDLQTLGIRALPVLYQMAKAEQLSRVPTPTRTVPNKSSAETSVGKKSAPIVKDKSYYNNLTPKQIEEELGVTPKYYD